jgi:hypothetical protein
MNMAENPGRAQQKNPICETLSALRLESDALTSAMQFQQVGVVKKRGEG